MCRSWTDSGVVVLIVSLAVGAVESTLATADTGGSAGRIGITEPRSRPSAHGAQWAVGAARGRAAQLGAEVHQRLVPRPRLARGHERIGGGLRGPGRQPVPGDAGEHPGDVRVDDRRIGLEGEREHGPGGVLPDAGEREEGVEVRRQPAAVVGDERRRGVMQVLGPSRVAEAVPHPQHVAERGGCARCRVGELGEERPPLGDDPDHLGLLQHDLGDEDRPRIPGPAPRQVPQPWHSPGQHRRCHQLRVGDGGRPAVQVRPIDHARMPMCPDGLPCRAASASEERSAPRRGAARPARSAGTAGSE